MTAEAPIMVRARITHDEWEAVRIAAIRQNLSNAEWLALAIRAYLADTTQNGDTQ